MSDDTLKKLQDLEQIIDYKFKDRELLIRAMTHRSYANENKDISKNNEKLELLGDAVLGLVSLRYLLNKYIEYSEGSIVKVKSILVSELMLSEAAKSIFLGEFLYLSRGEDQNNGRSRNSILSDAFEALVGAIFIDGGLEVADKFLSMFLLNRAEGIINLKNMVDYKTILQEHSQANYKSTPKYELIDEYGPDHEKTFIVGIYLDKKLVAKSKGNSKKEAEQNAAKEAAEKLNIRMDNIFV